MIKGVVFEINSSYCTICLSNKETYTLPKEFFPNNIEEFNFVKIDNGKVTIDENSDDYLELMNSLILNNNK